MVGAPSAIWLGVPLKIDKETIGVMVVQHYSSPNAYGPQELRMLEYVSSQVARSIERKRTEEALRDLVRQKEILMKELQHRVKNSLAIVSSLLGLEMDDLADAKSRAVFVNARSRIRSIGSLYERLYLASDIDNVDLGAYIRELAESLFKTFAPGNVRLTTRLDEVRLDTKRAAPLGLILNELVTNALKYAYPGGAKGEVCVGLEKSADTVTLSVADDGVGLPDGFDPETSGGMGTSLVRMLAGEIDGTLSYEGRKGTRVSIRLKP
jgi:two-component sensor histidine kinase